MTRFRIAKAPEPPALGLTLAAPVRLVKNGKVRLQGTVSCRHAGGTAAVYATVRQDWRRHIIRGQRSSEVACGSTWSMVVGNAEYRFATGAARVKVVAMACNVTDCRRASIWRSVRVT